MNRLHYLQVVLLIVASLIFISGLAYLNKSHTGGVGLIESFYFAESSTTQKPSEAYAQPVGLSLTERRAAYIFIGLSFVILISIIVIALKDRIKIGQHTVQIPFVTISALLLFTFTSQLFRFWF